MSWYESAERKAQLILTLDGIFVSFLTASLLSKPGDVRPIFERFGVETWFFFSSMLASLVLSILSAVLCLVSRLYSRRRLGAEYRRHNVNLREPATYKPEIMWFFQHVAGLRPEAVGRRLAEADEEFEREALATQIVPLARNVVAKHRLANLGFMFAGVVLVSFLGTGVSYVIRVA
jgi:hypothetical protein